MTRMVGTGDAPQGYGEGQVFDVPDQDYGTVEDLERKGWAKRVDPADDPGRTKVQIANAMVRGDLLNHPDDAAVADEIGSHDAALAIVHLEDADATEADYEEEAEEGRKRNALGQPYTDAERRVLERDSEHVHKAPSGGKKTKADKKSD